MRKRHSLVQNTVQKILHGVLLGWMLLPAMAFAEDWIYSVRPGDTLWDLCLEYTVKKNCWREIGPYNQVRYPPHLAPGTRIRFPVAWLRHPPEPAVVEFVKGAGRAVLPNSTSPASSALAAGMELPMGSEVVLEENAHAVLRFADGSRMEIEGGSELRLDVLSNFGQRGMVDTRVNLRKGAVQTRVPPREPRGRFEVTTPSSIAAVRGTDFRVTAITGVSRYEVYEGAVGVEREKTARPVLKAQGLVAPADSFLPEAQDLLPAGRFELGVQPLPQPTTVRWQEIAGAAEYRVSLAPEAAPLQRVLDAVITRTELRVDLGEAGCFAAELRGIDAQGLQGMPARETLCLTLRPPTPQEIVSRVIARHRVRLAWPRIPSARRYEIEFSRTENFDDITERFVSDDNFFETTIDKPGTHYARVRAIPVEGDPSDFSDVVLAIDNTRSRSGPLSWLSRLFGRE